MADISSTTIKTLLTVVPLAAWIQSVNRMVPQPYLDEFFHIPQAQAYWQGNFSHWDDKITTPPGLYFFSYVWHSILATVNGQKGLSARELRTDGFVTWLLLQGAIRLYEKLGKQVLSRNAHDETKQSSDGSGWVIMAFPLIFFFSGLYYTDVWSAFTVLATICAWRASTQSEGVVGLALYLLQIAFGLISLGSRQTNIFWVAVFTGGFQAIETVKKCAKRDIHDPCIEEAGVEDYIKLLQSLFTNALSIIPQLLIGLWPQLTLLVSFIGFVLWNGSVVLGDKSNHAASIHFAQMLYIWPFMMFFSWPVLLPHLARPRTLWAKVPRLTTTILSALAVVGIVHVNTVIHKFLLADNRHYTFYIFKALRMRPWIFYAAVPVYMVCAWMTIVALSSPAPSDTSRQEDKIKSETSASGSSDMRARLSANRISFVLIWLISSALSLVTAPLVEFRYFIVSWLVWRLNVHDVETSIETTREQSGPEGQDGWPGLLGTVSRSLAERSLYVELAWYMLINLVTCYLFLYKGFEWPQEPGNTQRFMW